MPAAHSVHPTFSSTTSILAATGDCGYQPVFAEAGQALPSTAPESYRSVQVAGEVARALKMGGMEALLFVSDMQGHPRPVVSALLNRLEIRGMNT